MVSRVVSGKTRVCGIIGDPIEHSMSPVIHNAAFKKRGLDYIYVPFRVSQEELVRAIDGMRALDIKGLNVTIPHKVAVIPLLDKIDPLAEKIGAVNTIVNNSGTLSGYNTDATGFLQALVENGVQPERKSVVILGAGGASRAICFILAEKGANLVILNRRHGRAEALARRTSQLSMEMNGGNLATVLATADILVNATSVGMDPDIDSTLVPTRLLRPGLTVVDLVYNPIKTRLLAEAEAAGARTIGGLDMLVWQGALAFENWTGRKAPVAVMKEAALKALKHED